MSTCGHCDHYSKGATFIFCIHRYSLVEYSDWACGKFSGDGCLTICNEDTIDCTHEKSWGKWICGKCAHKEVLKVGGVLVVKEEALA